MGFHAYLVNSEQEIVNSEHEIVNRNMSFHASLVNSEHDIVNSEHEIGNSEHEIVNRNMDFYASLMNSGHENRKNVKFKCKLFFSDTECIQCISDHTDGLIPTLSQTQHKWFANSEITLSDTSSGTWEMHTFALLSSVVNL